MPEEGETETIVGGGPTCVVGLPHTQVSLKSWTNASLPPNKTTCACTASPAILPTPLRREGLAAGNFCVQFVPSQIQVSLTCVQQVDPPNSTTWLRTES